MELRHVWYFSAALDAGSLAAAAAKLRVAQPALSRQIRDLEDELGVPLFERESTGVRATSAGLVFGEQARRLGDSLQQALAMVRRAHAGQLGVCRIGVGHVFVLGSRMGSDLAEIRRRLPGVQLDIREMIGSEHARALRAGEIDLGIAVKPPPGEPGIEWESLYEDPIEYALLPATHPLATAASVGVDELRDDQLLMLEPSFLPHIFQPVVDDLRRLGFEPHQAFHSMPSLYSLVAAGRGWTLGTRAWSARPLPGTAAVRLRGFQHPLDVAMTWRSGEDSRLVNHVIGAFRDLRDASRDETGAGTVSPPAPDADAAIPPTLELRHLRAFVVAAAEGSLSRAADILGVTQSAVSRQIQDLERITGGSLLERAARGVAPTAAGQVFQPEAAAVLAVADEAIARVRFTGRGVRGRCVFGVVPTAMEPQLLPAMLRELGRRFSDLELVVEEVPSAKQVAALVEESIDIGVAHAFPGLIDTPGIDSARIVDDTLECALIAASHPLSGKSSVSPKDLESEPFLFVARSFHPPFYDAVMRTFHALGFIPRVDATYDGLRTLWALAATGAGWAIGSRRQCAAPPEGLVALRIEGFELPWGLELLWRRDEREESIRACIDALRLIIPGGHESRRN